MPNLTFEEYDFLVSEIARLNAECDDWMKRAETAEQLAADTDAKLIKVVLEYELRIKALEAEHEAAIIVRNCLVSEEQMEIWDFAPDWLKSIRAVEAARKGKD